MANDARPQGVDELRRLSEELERERSRLIAAQRVAKVGSWETDLRTLGVMWSDETFRIFGLDPNHYSPTHESFLGFVHPDDRETVDAAFRASFGTREVCSVQHRVVAADGALKFVEERWQTFVDEHGQPIRAAGTCQDITERKRLEAHHLRAQRLESLGTLAGGIAHDLNNVLTPILASIDLLRGEADPESRELLLQNMETSALRGAAMVRQVLAFARGSEGAALSVSASAVIGDVAKILGETLPKDILLRTDVSANLKRFRGDPTQLHQVLMNLALNARDAMPQGGALTIRARNETLDDVYSGMHPEARPGEYVCITVADTGAGIAPALLERIFEPFFTTKPIGKGTGLGLSTVHSIVREHGGFVNAYSELGKGSRFTVYFPVDGAAIVPPEGNEAAPSRIPRGRGELVLVVDDELAIREVVRRTLERYGYRVRVATNGADGVAAFVEARGEVQLVLSDMAMPLLDGPSMVRALRAIQPSIRIIGSSGLTAIDDSQGAKEIGVQRWVPKPYTAEELLTAIREELDAGPLPEL